MKVMSLDECRNALVEANIVTGLNEQVWFALGWCQTVRRAELPGLRFRKGEHWISPDNKGYEGRRPDLINSLDAQRDLALSLGVRITAGRIVPHAKYGEQWRAEGRAEVVLHNPTPEDDPRGIRSLYYTDQATSRAHAELAVILSLFAKKKYTR